MILFFIKNVKKIKFEFVIKNLNNKLKSSFWYTLKNTWKDRCFLVYESYFRENRQDRDAIDTFEYVFLEVIALSPMMYTRLSEYGRLYLNKQNCKDYSE